MLTFSPLGNIGYGAWSMELVSTALQIPGSSYGPFASQFSPSLLHGHCSQEIRDTIPVPLRRVMTTRSSTHSHPFQVPLPNPRTLSHKSSFIPRTCNLWNVLPSCCFPESYNLPSFKSKINKLDLFSLSS